MKPMLRFWRPIGISAAIATAVIEIYRNSPNATVVGVLAIVCILLAEIAGKLDDQEKK